MSDNEIINGLIESVKAAQSADLGICLIQAEDGKFNVVITDGKHGVLVEANKGLPMAKYEETKAQWSTEND